MRLAPLLLAVLLALGLSGCLRTGVNASLYNDTDEEQHVGIWVTDPRMHEPPSFVHAVTAAPGAGPIDLGRIISRNGDYTVIVGGSLNAPDAYRENITYSRTGGPDHVTIRLTPDGVTFSVAVV